MSSEQLLLVMTAVLAVVATAAAFVAVRAARRLRTAPQSPPLNPPRPAAEAAAAPRTTSTDVVMAPQDPAPEVRIVEGRVIVAPTSRQVVEATMGKPLVRASIISHGLAHALRPESRDRIMALMRREFRSRRRQRKRAAKQAARLAHPQPRLAVDSARNRAIATNEAWLGELPAARHAAPTDRETGS